MKGENPYKKEIIRFIKDNGGIDDDKEAEICYKKAQGIFITSNFEADLIIVINKWNKENRENPIDLYKLLYFKTKDSNFIVLDKIIDQSLRKKRKRFIFNWKDAVKFYDDLEMGDLFYIDKKYTNGDNIELEIADTKSYVTLTENSIKLMRKKDYLKKCEEFGSEIENFPRFDNPEYYTKEYFPKVTWNYKPFKKIFSDEFNIEDAAKIKIPPTNLFQLVLLANNNNRSGWNPAGFFIHQRTNKTYKYFRDNLKK